MNFGYYPYQNNNPYQQQLTQMQQSQQNSSFIHVPSEEVARSYSVAPGGSVTFINDNAPYCYTKTAGFSQFDAPIFRKFRLVEETASEQQKPKESPQASSSVTVETLSNEIQALRARIEALESKPIETERRMKNEPFDKQRKSGGQSNNSTSGS